MDADRAARTWVLPGGRAAPAMRPRWPAAPSASTRRGDPPRSRAPAARRRAHAEVVPRFVVCPICSNLRESASRWSGLAPSFGKRCSERRSFVAAPRLGRAQLRCAAGRTRRSCHASAVVRSVRICVDLRPVVRLAPSVLGGCRSERRVRGRDQSTQLSEPLRSLSNARRRISGLGPKFSRSPTSQRVALR